MKKFIEFILNIPKDKILHFIVSAIITAVFTLIFKSFGMGLVGIAYAWGICFAIGVAKEVYDTFKSKPEEGDWVADLLGNTVSAIYALLLLI